MPKKQVRNGYYYFMLDFRRREEQAGRRFHGGMKEIASLASDGWKDLSQADRDGYNEYAKQNRHEDGGESVQRPARQVKYNSLGINLNTVKKEMEDAKERDIAIRKFVDDFVVAKDGIDELKNDEMYLIHVNIFCKTYKECYYPAEVAICKFNIQSGPVATYHTFIDPGPIDMGYMFALKENSNKFHKITLPFVQGNPNFKNYEKIYDDITQFLELNSGRNQSVPLFTMYDDTFYNTSFKAVEKLLEGLYKAKHSTGQEIDAWRTIFGVYPLPLLFTQLKNNCYYKAGRNKIGFPNSSLATIELNQDTYKYTEKYACYFHQQEICQDGFQYCSQSFVTRWAKIINDHCMDALNLEKSKMVIGHNTVAQNLDGGRGEECKEDFIDCKSLVSAMRSKINLVDEASLGFGEGNSDQKKQSSNACGISGSSSAGAWQQTGRGRGQRAASTAVDDQDFPALGGIQRGVKNLKLDP